MIQETINKGAFENYKLIDKLSTREEQQKAWLDDYHGLKYSIALEKKHQIKWKTDPKYYDLREFNSMINCIARKKDRLVIEFDNVEGDEKNAAKALETVKELLKEKGYGFIESSHNSVNSNYLWVEFTSDLTTITAKKFLVWLCPDGARIDLNFCSDAKLFPVLFARHWKYSQSFEMPVDFFEGVKIDIKQIDLVTNSPKETITFDNGGFAYSTYKASTVFGVKGQSEIFTNTQPLFYDKAGLWWLWNPEKFYWETVDEVEILNMIESATGQDIIEPKNRTLILNALKQKGRKMIPKPIKPTWIQFKDVVIDIENGERMKASASYFITNPIPFELSDNAETPTMDRIFEEWVGKEYVFTLYQILAYCLIPDYPINRLFCLIGGGMNGKSKFLELLYKFIGPNNCTSTELDTLLTSRFEITRLHKKLVCLMGETNFNEMTKTSILKKLTGGDLIGFEYKNKNPFHDRNYAKIIIATNNLPTTTDKSIGFYRRWMIIDFPNQFTEKKDILAEIPEEEYNSLALKCTLLLKDLIESRQFLNEGSVEERMKKFEDKSNFLQQFVNKYTIGDSSKFITFSEFKRKFKEWCKENRYRELSDTSIGRSLSEIGIEKSRKHLDWLFDGKGGQARVLLDITWKD